MYILYNTYINQIKLFVHLKLSMLGCKIQGLQKEAY